VDVSGRVLHIEEHAGECLNYEQIFLIRIIRTKHPSWEKWKETQNN